MQSVVITSDKDNRLNFKNKLLEKVETALIPPTLPIESEPVEVEIVEKYASGIPKRVLGDTEPVFSDSRIDITPTLESDTPKRLAFKNNLLKKVSSIKIAEPEKEIEIIGYAPRSIIQFGPEFEESNRVPLIVSDFKEETVVDFTPVTEEAPLPVLRLPENYGDLDERALYGVLIRNSDLKHSSETANLALDVLSGRSSRQVEFVIVETPKPAGPEPVVSVPEPVVSVPEPVVSVPEPMVSVPTIIKALEPFNFDLPSDWKSIPLATLRTDLLSTGATPEQVDAKLAELVQKSEASSAVKTTAESFTIDLPEEFSSWKPVSQYIYLTKERKLTPEQANAVIWEINLEN